MTREALEIYSEEEAFWDTLACDKDDQRANSIFQEIRESFQGGEIPYCLIMHEYLNEVKNTDTEMYVPMPEEISKFIEGEYECPYVRKIKHFVSSSGTL